ncbi:uncharacterized protein LOC135483075 isoform X2 [Lineus longissimus]|uniref:uncharacterized protein LOC135483075 isoform X2 n=1 Tax=Lineus longissimus TaxID=88925 RepID=UPI002B4C9EBB
MYISTHITKDNVSPVSNLFCWKDSLKVRFESYEACRKGEVLDHIKSTILTDSSSNLKMSTVGVTIGHGTIETHAETISDVLGITPIQVDEFTAFTKGFHYGQKNLPRETFIKKNMQPETEKRGREFPALLAMVGSAVGYILVNEDGSHSQVNGTMMGGLYCYSVGKLLTGAKTYAEFAEMARRGDSKKLTVTTRDLFSGSYGDVDWDKVHSKIPFPLEVFPFGKIVREGLDIESLNKDDIARAWMHSVVAQILVTSVATAQKYCDENRVVYYAGSFAENDVFQSFHDIMPHHVYYDNRTVYPCFLNNAAYLGSLGGLLVGLESL